jgi:hypothetical protein
MNYQSASFWVCIASLLVALASLIIAGFATLIARNSLLQAERVAERDLRDWRQRKWFDLYFMASEVYHSLDRFKSKHEGKNPATRWDQETLIDFNELMFATRKLGAVAFVFPKCPSIDQLIGALAVFSNRDEAFSSERLDKVFDAVENVRAKTLVDASILG